MDLLWTVVLTRTSVCMYWSAAYMSTSCLSWEGYNPTPWGRTVLQFSLRTALASLLYMPSQWGTTGLTSLLAGTLLIICVARDHARLYSSNTEITRLTAECSVNQESTELATGAHSLTEYKTFPAHLVLDTWSNEHCKGRESGAV